MRNISNTACSAQDAVDPLAAESTSRDIRSAATVHMIARRLSEERRPRRSRTLVSYPAISENMGGIIHINNVD